MSKYNEKVLISEVKKVRKAQELFSTFTQEQVDRIFQAAAKAANENRIMLARLAVEETGMGYLEDKVIKNHFASEFVYNKYKDTKTCDLIEEDVAGGIRIYAEPIGVVAAVIPTTNPTSTAIFKTLLALKTRNAIFIAPHPRARNSTIKAAEIVMQAAVKAGAPEGLLGYIDEIEEGINPIELTNKLMAEADIILATGGPAMVHAAYSSGTPAIGVGAGNTAAIIHESAEIKLGVSSIINSKCFDYGVICASEQAVIIDEKIYDETKNEFIKRGAYVLNKSELKKVQNIILKNGKLNADLVGQAPEVIAEMAGISIPDGTKIIIGEVSDYSLNEPFAHEKLSVLLAMYKYETFAEALEISNQLIMDSGLGHTSSIFADEYLADEAIREFSRKMKTCRVLVNSGSSQGGIGDIYNFVLEPSLTLGCGSWGNNSVSENVGVKHLLNTKTVAYRRENAGWVQLPKKTFFKFGSLATALEELAQENFKRVFIVTDKVLHELNYTNPITKKLESDGVLYSIFSDVSPDPSINDVRNGAEAMSKFAPDCIITIGGGSAIDAAKIMWLMYEEPDAKFEDLSLTFMDIRKRIVKFPKLGQKAYFVAITTTQGTGSEVTPFSVITDEEGIKYPLADYAITPDMAVSDAQLALEMPKGLTVASGIDVFTHAIESYVSILANEMSEPYSIQAMQLVHDYLEESYNLGNKAKNAKEKMAMASTMAGIAFANAFLGINHSLAHKIGAKFHIPHGIANALVMIEVIKYNATDKPYRSGVFSQYKYPTALSKYAAAAKHLGYDFKTDEEGVEKLIMALQKLMKNLEIPSSIKEYGIDEKEFVKALTELAENAFNDQCTGANPRYPKITDLEEILLRSYYGNEYSGEKTY